MCNIIWKWIQCIMFLAGWYQHMDYCRKSAIYNCGLYVTKTKHIVMWWRDYRPVLLMIRFIGLFYTAHDYTLQFTITHNSVHSNVFSSRCLVVASNDGNSASSGFPNCSWSQLPASHDNSSQRLNLSSSLPDLIQSLTNTTSHYCCIQLLPWKHDCLQSCYSVTAVSAGFTVFALCKYATIYKIYDMYSEHESEYNKIRTMTFINIMH
jgi:hypothetical protein